MKDEVGYQAKGGDKIARIGGRVIAVQGEFLALLSFFEAGGVRGHREVCNSLNNAAVLL